MQDKLREVGSFPNPEQLQALLYAGPAMPQCARDRLQVALPSGSLPQMTPPSCVVGSQACEMSMSVAPVRLSLWLRGQALGANVFAAADLLHYQATPWLAGNVRQARDATALA